ncbi:hypothetical protein [Pseudidiomarina sp.]
MAASIPNEAILIHTLSLQEAKDSSSTIMQVYVSYLARSSKT